jgi:hypothetical protein
MSNKLAEESLAEFFHDTYESLAPQFGYETRPDTKRFNPDSPNGKLMIAVCKKVNEYYARRKEEDWISVEKELPPVDTFILVYRNYLKEERGAWIEIILCENNFKNDYKKDRVTHWQPLPEPPTEAG